VFVFPLIWIGKVLAQPAGPQAESMPTIVADDLRLWCEIHTIYWRCRRPIFGVTDFKEEESELRDLDGDCIVKAN